MKIESVDEEETTITQAFEEKLSLDNRALLFLNALPEPVKAKVKSLQEIQVQHDSLYEKFLEERSALEKKYEVLYEPLYEQRLSIVTGEKEGVEQQKDIKGIPDFWLTALKHNIIIAETITEKDEGALKFLKNIVAHSLTDAKGFKLEFFFEKNPYFTNEVLSKTYFMIDEDEPILEKAEGTQIEWVPGKDLTKKLMKKKPKKGAKNTKLETKTVDCESFFNFFSPPQVPGENEQLEEEEAEELQELMENDYDIGSTIREKIIPHAVYWFTGEAIDAEDYLEEEDEDEDDADGEEGDDEDEEEDDEEEDGEEPTPVKKTKKKGSAKVAPGENPECKQQ